MPPARRRSDTSQRDTYHAPRRWKLSAEQAVVLRASAGNRTLRELAAEYGVSHETVRAVVREVKRTPASVLPRLG